MFFFGVGGGFSFEFVTFELLITDGQTLLFMNIFENEFWLRVLVSNAKTMFYHQTQYQRYRRDLKHTGQWKDE